MGIGGSFWMKSPFLSCSSIMVVDDHFGIAEIASGRLLGPDALDQFAGAQIEAFDGNAVFFLERFDDRLRSKARPATCCRRRPCLPFSRRRRRHPRTRPAPRPGRRGRPTARRGKVSSGATITISSSARLIIMPIDRINRSLRLRSPHTASRSKPGMFQPAARLRPAPRRIPLSDRSCGPWCGPARTMIFRFCRSNSHPCHGQRNNSPRRLNW